MRPCRISSVAVSWTTSLCIIYKVKRRNTSSAFRFGTADKYTQCYAANNTHKGTIFTRNRKKTALSMSTRISNGNVRIKISWRPDNVTLLAPPLLFVYFVPGVAATIIFYTILVTGRQSNILPAVCDRKLLPSGSLRCDEMFNTSEHACAAGLSWILLILCPRT